MYKEIDVFLEEKNKQLLSKVTRIDSVELITVTPQINKLRNSDFIIYNCNKSAV